MDRFLTLLGVLITLALMATLIGCGGSDTDSNASTGNLLISISPSSATVPLSGTQQFFATVSGATNTSVSWSVLEGTAGGSITPQGRYTAPATAGSYHVIATSVADSTRNDIVVVTVGAGAARVITVDPAVATVVTDTTRQFTAAIDLAPATDVLWTVLEGAVGGTITTDGAYTAPRRPGLYHVIATDAADRNNRAVADVTVTDPFSPVRITLDLPSVITAPSMTQQLTATVTGTANTAVNWNVLERTPGGTVTQDGLYTAPTEGGTFHVIATSVADPAMTATSTIMVMANGEQPGYTFAQKWGILGTQNGNFVAPSGLAMDRFDNLYVTDADTHSLQKFTSSGVFLMRRGEVGHLPGQYKGPMDVAVDADTHIFIIDTGNNRVQKLSDTGEFMRQWGAWGSDVEELRSPLGITVDAAGNTYVADTDNHRIQKFRTDGWFITAWGTKGTFASEFDCPQDVAVSADGQYVYVADTGNHRVQKFTSAGAFITEWGYFGCHDDCFNTPCSIAVDALGYVYVMDKGNLRVLKFTADGELVTKFGGLWGRGDGQFDAPDGLVVDSQGNVYIADTGNHRIQKFVPNL